MDLRQHKVAFIVLFHCLISTQTMDRLLRALAQVLQRMQAADGVFIVDPFAFLTRVDVASVDNWRSKRRTDVSVGSLFETKLVC